MKPTAWFFTLASLLVWVSNLTATPLAPYQYTRTITGAWSQHELVALNLDDTIWQAIGTEAIDLRIVDQDGRAVPHLLRQAGTQETRTVRKPCATRIEQLSEQPDNRIELQISLEKDAPAANGITFNTPLQDFEKTVSVWGRTDTPTPHETLLVSAARIYDYHRFADVRQTDVALPAEAADYRTFRVVIEDSQDETQMPMRWETRRYTGDQEVEREAHTRILQRPFRMDAVQLYRETRETAHRVPRLQAQTFASLTIRKEQDPAVTILTVEHHGGPLTALHLDCEEANFSRHVTLAKPVRRDGRETWQQIAAGRIARIAFRDFQHTALRLPFPETRALRYEVTLQDHDNPPLTGLAVTGEGPIWQAVFLAEPGKTYSVYYGPQAQPRPPQYDLAPLEQLLARQPEPFVAAMEPPGTNPAYHRTGILGRETTMRMFFAAAILCMLAVLAFALYRAARHVT